MKLLRVYHCIVLQTRPSTVLFCCVVVCTFLVLVVCCVFNRKIALHPNNTESKHTDRSSRHTQRTVSKDRIVSVEQTLPTTPAPVIEAAATGGPDTYCSSSQNVDVFNFLLPPPTADSLSCGEAGALCTIYKAEYAAILSTVSS